MEATIPHEIIYETSSPVPIADIIESLRGTVQVVQEIGPLLESLVPGLVVRDIQISIKEISQQSPLREAFAVSIVALYRSKLGEDMPKILHDLFGVDIPKEYNTIVSLVFIVLVFYAGQFMFDQLGRVVERKSVRRQYNALISEISIMMGKSEDEIKRLLHDRFGIARITPLIAAANRVLLPSKNQANAPVTINKRALPHKLVADFPSKAQITEDESGTISDPLNDVEIQLHA